MTKVYYDNGQQIVQYNIYELLDECTGMRYKAEQFESIVNELKNYLTAKIENPICDYSTIRKNDLKEVLKRLEELCDEKFQR